MLVLHEFFISIKLVRPGHILTAMSNIYNGFFLREQFLAFSRQLLSHKKMHDRCLARP